MSWQFLPASSFEQVREFWDVPNRARGNHILLDSSFVAPLIKYFGKHSVVVGISENSQHPAAALLVRKRPGIWESFQPSQAPLGLVLFGQRDESGDNLRDLLRVLPGTGLQLSILQQDPDYSAWPRFNGNGDIQTLDYIKTARLVLIGTFDEFWRTRSSNLRHNLGRQRRRLREKGQEVELRIFYDEHGIADGVQEYARLESRGWKSGGGTALSEDNTQGRFYHEALQALASRGEARVYQLLLNGTVAATDLCVYRNGMLVILKTTYDEKLNHISPALLLLEDIVRHLYEEKKVRVVEFYGKAMDWHAKWSEDFRVMYHLNCFRSKWMSGLKKGIKQLI